MSHERRKLDREQGEILLDKYLILKNLHLTNSSEVFLVKDINLENQMVIKKYACSHLGKENFLREASILKNLNHNRIPIIYDVIEKDNENYIIEEFIEGYSLFDYIQRYGVLEEHKAIDYGIQISKIIAFMHNQQPRPILHLDLKPQNIMVNNDKIYIIDFGNSMFENSSRQYMSGTRGFAPPEQYELNKISQKADIYGIGALLYYMVTGNVYDKEKSVSDIEFYVSEKFKQLVVQCLLPREDRINDALWVAESLNNIIQEKILRKEIKNEDSMEKSLDNVSRNIGRRKRRIKNVRERGFLDSLQEKNGVKTIGILGSCRGDGVTTLSIAMANYIAEVMSKKTAIIECNDYKSFDIMIDLLQGDREENHYGIGKVNYFYGVDLNVFFATYASEYDFVVIDFGNSIKGFKDNILKLKHKIILGSVMPYKCEYHQLVIKAIQNMMVVDDALHLLVGDKKSVKDYSLKNKISALPKPNIVNPYIIESELTNFFQLLF